MQSSTSSQVAETSDAHSLRILGCLLVSSIELPNGRLVHIERQLPFVSSPHNLIHKPIHRRGTTSQVHKTLMPRHGFPELIHRDTTIIRGERLKLLSAPLHLSVGEAGSVGKLTEDAHECPQANRCSVTCNGYNVTSYGLPCIGHEKNTRPHYHLWQLDHIDSLVFTASRVEYVLQEVFETFFVALNQGLEVIEVEPLPSLTLILQDLIDPVAERVRITELQQCFGEVRSHCDDAVVLHADVVEHRADLVIRSDFEIRKSAAPVANRRHGSRFSLNLAAQF
mmetsp:Transcript_46241/g.110016  ORF Transcript_46241/g.110016 Transcript_46241/m.110016 type:complete len:281 (+) Transcript_46241:1203-2045(+)